jgi:hypothetical protein
LAALVLLGLTSECRPRKQEGRDVTESPHQATTLPELAREVGVTFPASAGLIGVARERGIDDMVMFKVEMSSNDLPSFMAALPVPNDAFEPGEGSLLGPDQGFWDPRSAAHLRTGQVIVKNQRALNIGIGDGRPGTVAIYVVNHGT